MRHLAAERLHCLKRTVSLKSSIWEVYVRQNQNHDNDGHQSDDQKWCQRVPFPSKRAQKKPLSQSVTVVSMPVTWFEPFMSPVACWKVS
jgi:hypothetical protein